ncbi:hypothetical protein DERF_012626 [Dermatophagoides farinae]|uniref:Uncharacterized protein n=1 Tax=Dermatophagoides farinae TaxID=6954 RepID=A0A922L3M4_DERFA|nr:hypothetical protein DERF_012626 [Dermatophagoides farinae]
MKSTMNVRPTQQNDLKDDQPAIIFLCKCDNTSLAYFKRVKSSELIPCSSSNENLYARKSPVSFTKVTAAICGHNINLI